MAKVYLSAVPVARPAGFGGVPVAEPAASRSLPAESGRERLPGLAAGEAVFLPADPPRSGRVAFWTSSGGLPDLGVEPEELTVVRPHGSSVRRARVMAVLLPVEQALPDRKSVV